MTPDSYLSIVKDTITVIAIVAGDGWTLWKFVIQRESHPKIEFGIDLRILGKYDDRILVEVVAIIENKGLVRHCINDFSFDLLYLKVGEKLINGDDSINEQVLFKKEIPRKYWIPVSWNYTFIDPKIKQEYTYIASLPHEAVYALLLSRFSYVGKKQNFHTAQKTFKISV